MLADLFFRIFNNIFAPTFGNKLKELVFRVTKIWAEILLKKTSVNFLYNSVIRISETIKVFRTDIHRNVSLGTPVLFQITDYLSFQKV